MISAGEPAAQGEASEARELCVRGDAWRARAACLGQPTEWWFVGKGGSYARARAICTGCPVRTDCLSDDLAHIERSHPGERSRVFGMRGGLTPRQRQRLVWARNP